MRLRLPYIESDIYIFYTNLKNSHCIAHTFSLRQTDKVRVYVAELLLEALVIAVDILVISTRDVKTLRPKLWSTKRE